MLTGKRLDGWNAFFLATTVATSVTGFGFPIRGFTPGIGLSILSLLVLAVAIYARYARHLAGVWRRVYVISATTALYFNFFVLILSPFKRCRASRLWPRIRPNRPLRSPSSSRSWRLSSSARSPRRGL